jgi:hypothetical protein
MMDGDDLKPTVFIPPDPPPHVGAVDPSKIKPYKNGCPNCTEYPDFPRRHCGLPGCRDEQAVAYARATGRDPHEVLAAMDEQQTPQGGLCGACQLVEACVLGRAVMDTHASLSAVIAQCDGYKAG